MKVVFRIAIWLLSIFILCSILFFFIAGSAGHDASEYDLRTRYSRNVSERQDTLTVMTYNIGYLSGMTNNRPVDRDRSLFQRNRDTILTLLKQHPADIIAIQEIDFRSDRTFFWNQLDTLGYRLNMSAGAMAVNWDKRFVPFPYWPPSKQFGEMFSGQAVLSHLPIPENRIVVLSKPVSRPFWYNQFYLDRLAQISVVGDTLPVTIVNVHLEAFDVDTREIQADELVALVKPMVLHQRVILLGDFNSRMPFHAEDRTMKTILDELGMVSAIPDSLPGIAPTGTYPSDDPNRRIDHILYRPDQFELIDWQIPASHVSASDHRPVVARLRCLK